MNKETLKMKALMSLGKLSIVQIDGKTATMAINSEWDLKIDTSFPPELWEAYTRKQKKSFDWTKSPDVPPFVRGVIEELRDIYNDACISLAMSEEEDKTEIEEDSGNETENLEAHNPEKEDEPTQKTIHSAKEKKNLPARKSAIPTTKIPSSVSSIPSDMRSKQISDLSLDTIKQYICPKATDQEAYFFLQLCKARNLNPFLNEAYLIKYDANTPAQMVVGKEAFIRRAEKSPHIDGFTAGVIVRNTEGTIERREGTFVIPGEQTLGGWAEVYLRVQLSNALPYTRPLTRAAEQVHLLFQRSLYRHNQQTRIFHLVLSQAFLQFRMVMRYAYFSKGLLYIDSFY